MKKINTISVLIFLCSILSTSFVFAQATATIPFYLKRNKTAKKFVRGEVLVKYKSLTSKSETLRSIKINGAESKGSLDKNGLHRVKLLNNQSVESAIEQFQRDPNVEYAQPNYLYKISSVPNDPQYGQQWGLRNTGQTITAANGPGAVISTNNPGTAGNDMDLTSAWNNITDCSSVVVAVLDTGVNYNQSDLTGSMWDGGPSIPNHGYDFVDSDIDPMDKNGHGTHVAGTIGATGNNSIGGTGVCWKASIMALRVGDAAGSISTANLVSAISYAITYNAKVINMSLGTSALDTAFNNAMTSANTAGIISVVAAGNEDEDNDSGSTPTYPCNFTQSNIVCVAALDQAYSLASFSNVGATSVDVAAPGVNIYSTWPGTHTTTSDSLTSGWSNSTVVSGGGWGYKQLNFGSLTNTLADPASYDHSSATYVNNADDRIWKSFNLSGAAAATTDFYIMIDTESGYDGVILYAKSSTGDPVSGGSVVDSYSGTSSGYAVPQTVDVSDFISSNTTIGFRLLADSSNVSYGANISLFTTTKLALNTSTYNVSAGTSMATPHVAGLAALIWAYNPNYTAADVVESIKQGGDSLSVLASKTTTGKAVNAMGSLAYISAPTNLSVVKQ